MANLGKSLLVPTGNNLYRTATDQQLRMKRYRTQERTII
jgi:hypothetical protein